MDTMDLVTNLPLTQGGTFWITRSEYNSPRQLVWIRSIEVNVMQKFISGPNRHDVTIPWVESWTAVGVIQQGPHRGHLATYTSAADSTAWYEHAPYDAVILEDELVT